MRCSNRAMPLSGYGKSRERALQARAKENASRKVSLVLHCGQQFGKHHVDAAVLLEAGIVVLSTYWIQLAPSGGVADLRIADSALVNDVLHELGAPVGKHEVVENIAANVGVALDPEMRVGVLLEPVGIALEHRRIMTLLYTLKGK